MASAFLSESDGSNQPHSGLIIAETQWGPCPKDDMQACLCPASSGHINSRAYTLGPRPAACSCRPAAALPISERCWGRPLPLLPSHCLRPTLCPAARRLLFVRLRRPNRPPRGCLRPHCINYAITSRFAACKYAARTLPPSRTPPAPRTLPASPTPPAVPACCGDPVCFAAGPAVTLILRFRCSVPHLSPSPPPHHCKAPQAAGAHHRRLHLCCRRHPHGTCHDGR